MTIIVAEAAINVDTGTVAFVTLMQSTESSVCMCVGEFTLHDGD